MSTLKSGFDGGPEASNCIFTKPLKGQSCPAKRRRSRRSISRGVLARRYMSPLCTTAVFQSEPRKMDRAFTGKKTDPDSNGFPAPVNSSPSRVNPVDVRVALVCRCEFPFSRSSSEKYKLSGE